MTIICAIKDPKNKCIWLGSDQQVTWGDTRLFFGPKWIISKGWGIGHAGDVRAGNLIHRHWPDVVAKGKSIFDITVHLRDLFIQDGYEVKKEQDKFPSYGQNLIITDSVHLWDIGGNFAFNEVPDDIMLLQGSGWRFGLGAFHALSQNNPAMPRKALVKAVLDTACNFDIYSGQGTWIHSMPSKMPQK